MLTGRGLQELPPSTALSWAVPLETMGPGFCKKTSAGRSQEQSEGQNRKCVAHTDCNNQSI